MPHLINNIRAVIDGYRIIRFTITPLFFSILHPPAPRAVDQPAIFQKMSEYTNGNTNGRIEELKQGQLPEHHVHHAQGDIGGTYADQPEEGGPHPEAFRVGEIVKEQTIEEEEREFEINEREARLRKERISIPEEKKPILIIVMVRNLFTCICMRTSILQMRRD